MTAPTLAPPVLTGDALAAEWERLGHAYNAGWTPDEDLWARVDALAPHLPETERSGWFEELYTALALRDGPIELADYPPDERDPDRIEAAARADVDEATARLAGWA